MRLLTALAVLNVVACDRRERSRPESTQAEAAKRHFAQYDQITAVATAKPIRGRVAYELRIKNMGSEPVVGLNETTQQWQPLGSDPRNLTEWSEHIPMATDSVGRFELGPGQEYSCEVEPTHRQGARLRFGFVVFTQVGDDDARRMRIWTETSTPESDFAGILTPAGTNGTTEQHGVGGDP